MTGIPLPLKNNKNEREISRRELCQVNYLFAEPFSLSLPDRQPSLYCDEMVRIIPGKRLVALGDWNGKPVAAKIFFGQHAKKNMERDSRGARALMKAKVPTPKLWYVGKAKDSSIYVLIFERILNAQSLEVFWQKHKNSPQGKDVLHFLTIEIATQHVLGLLQRDLHFKNFLLTDEKIYTLDGAGVSIFTNPLSKKYSIENVALFFSQLGVHAEQLQQDLFNTYCKARGWRVNKKELSFLQNTIYSWNRKRWLHYQKKIFRTSTSFARRKTIFSQALYNRQYVAKDFQAFLKNPDTCFSHSQTVILKAGRTSTVAKVIFGQRIFVVKRYNIKSIWHGLTRSFKPSRARLSWILSHQLCFSGIQTAKPVALIEKRFWGLCGKSYFVMEYVEGTPAQAFFDHASPEDPQSVVVAKRMIMLFFDLLQLQLCHGDLKITNMLINADQEPVLLDLDSMREYASSFGLWRRFQKDMLRFLENWKENPAWHAFFRKWIEKKAKLSQ